MGGQNTHLVPFAGERVAEAYRIYHADEKRCDGGGVLAGKDLIPSNPAPSRASFDGH